MDDLTTIQNGRKAREEKNEKAEALESILVEIEQAMREMEDDYEMVDSTLKIDKPRNDDEAAYAHLYRAWLLLSNQL
jgi:hypothetical protein|tara:strand:- start:281 stop:511 length:231 start_codon:yes stop_codon:yes gene_type:complete